MSHSLFLNLPSADLKRSMDFFRKLGFAFEPRFTNDDAACMVVDERNIFVMLLRPSFFQTFTSKPITDATKSTEVLVCLSLGTRAEVDAMVAKAKAAGGTISREPEDQGFMYSHAFEDLDGHIFELVWMDSQAQPAH